MTDQSDQPAGAGVEESAVLEAEIPASDATETTETKTEAEKSPPKTYTEEDFKRLENELARERRRINKITAQKYQFKSQADQYNQTIAELQKKIPAPQAPDISKYTDYDKYLTDKTRFEAEQILAAKQPQQTAQEDPQRQIWRAQRDQAIGSTIEQAKHTFPDVQQKLQQHAQLLDALPNHAADAIRETDQPILAIYQLIEDGMLPLLSGMNPDTVQAIVERAEEKALSRQKPIPQTKAPAPMTSARGTAPGSKALEAMSGDELLKWSQS